jgi:hypothetical protein
VNSHALKRKDDMDQYADIKVMSLPVKALKKQISNFKEMITFKEDKGP